MARADLPDQGRMHTDRQLGPGLVPVLHLRLPYVRIDMSNTETVSDKVIAPGLGSEWGSAGSRGRLRVGLGLRARKP